MKVGIMQPYLFPYIGYFQLIHAVDQFVIYDDVQFIKGGWINRNKILVNRRDYMFTFSLKKASSYLNINERYFSESFVREKNRFMKTLKESYGKTKNYEIVSSIVEQALRNGENNKVSNVVAKSLELICEYLEIDTKILYSSQFEKEKELNGEERVIKINKRLGATHYINPLGGKTLYSKNNFKNHHLKLTFLKPRRFQYPQKNVKEFVSSLSIIDVLMFNSKRQVKQYLNEYDLI